MLLWNHQKILAIAFPGYDQQHIKLMCVTVRWKQQYKRTHQHTNNTMHHQRMTSHKPTTLDQSNQECDIHMKWILATHNYGKLCSITIIAEINHQ